MHMRKLLRRLFHPKGKGSFLNVVKHNGALLDVGCGNNSPQRIKAIRPDVVYTGIDIQDYNQQAASLGKYIVTDAGKFAADIAQMAGSFDAVISSHNIEHCNDRYGTLEAMIRALKAGGLLYLAFPAAQSIHFPSRAGTLNYYDDPTHRDLPPDFEKIVSILHANNMDILYAAKAYRPFPARVAGAVREWVFRPKKVSYIVWAYYGFEAIIWARKK
jgi:SAM-dependent methyltransferase